MLVHRLTDDKFNHYCLIERPRGKVLQELLLDLSELLCCLDELPAGDEAEADEEFSLETLLLQPLGCEEETCVDERYR